MCQLLLNIFAQDIPLQTKQTNEQQSSSKNIDIRDINNCTIDDDDVTVEDSLSKTSYRPIVVQYSTKLSRLRAIGHQIR